MNAHYPAGSMEIPVRTTSKGLQLGSVEVELERLKVTREAGFLWPALGGSVLLMAAAAGTGIFYQMLVVVALRLGSDLLAGNAARKILRLIDHGADFGAEKRRAERTALLTGSSWGLAAFVTHDLFLIDVGAIMISLCVVVAGIMVMLVTAPSPMTLRSWVIGFVLGSLGLLLLYRHQADAIYGATWLAFATMLLLMAPLFRRQDVRTITLQIQNAHLTEELSIVNVALSRSLASAERLAHIDGLTSLPNRRAFEETAVRLHAGNPTRCHLLLIDVDHFKRVNDTFGHSLGDQVLVQVGKAITESIERSEVCARWGGEEFVALVLDCDEAGAISRAERLRRAVSARREPDWPAGLEGVTVSIGITLWSPDEALGAAILRADSAMYVAKVSGRNRTQFHYPHVAIT